MDNNFDAAIYMEALKRIKKTYALVYASMDVRGAGDDRIGSSRYHIVCTNGAESTEISGLLCGREVPKDRSLFITERIFDPKSCDCKVCRDKLTEELVVPTVLLIQIMREVACGELKLENYTLKSRPMPVSLLRINRALFRNNVEDDIVAPEMFQASLFGSEGAKIWI